MPQIRSAFLPFIACSINVKWSRYRPGVAQRVGRGIALLFHDRGTRRWWVVRARPGRTLPPGKTRYPFYRRLGGPQGRSGRAENLVRTGIRSRTVQPVSVAIPTELPSPQVWLVCTEINSRPLREVWLSLLRFLRTFSFTKLKNVQWCYVGTYCTVFYTSRSINMRSEGRNSITLLTNVSRKLTFFNTFFKTNPVSNFFNVQQPV